MPILFLLFGEQIQDGDIVGFSSDSAPESGRVVGGTQAPSCKDGREQGAEGGWPILLAIHYCFHVPWSFPVNDTKMFVCL